MNADWTLNLAAQSEVPIVPFIAELQDLSRHLWQCEEWPRQPVNLYRRRGLAASRDGRCEVATCFTDISTTAQCVMKMTFSEPRSLGLDQAIRVVLGPQDDYFTAAAIEEFLHGSYTIMPASDRIGFRLAGPLLAHESDYNIMSDGIVAGSIYVPGSKLPIDGVVDANI